MAGYYDRLRASLGYDTEPEPQGLLQQMQTELGEATRLSTQQRFWAFGGSVIATALFWGLVSNPHFCCPYVLRCIGSGEWG